MSQFGSHVPVAVSARQWRFSFPNGFGASVINDGYGSADGLLELAVLNARGHITYETPITDDVLGYLTGIQVADALDQIAALPAVSA
jgi:hypothetical protein